MSNIILTIPVEIREYIFQYCFRCDLVNFACCSKDSYNAVEYVLWEVLDTVWKFIEKRTIPAGKLQLLATHTKELMFSVGFDMVEWEDRKWRNVAKNYRQILKHCNVDKLRKITIRDGYMIERGIKLTCSMLTQLTEFTCCSSNEISSDAWKYLQQLQHLKKLCLIEIALSSTAIANIVQIENLEELDIMGCEIEDDWMEHISTLTRLKKLGFDGDTGVHESGIRHLGKLPNLEELTLGYTDVDRNGLLSIAVMLTSLKKLDINACSGLTSAGLMCLSQSDNLSELDISGTESNHLFHRDAVQLFCHVKKMKQKNTDIGLVLTKDERFWHKDDDGGISYGCIATVIKNLAREILEEFADLCATYLYLCKQEN